MNITHGRVEFLLNPLRWIQVSLVLSDNPSSITPGGTPKKKKNIYQEPQPSAAPAWPVGSCPKAACWPSVKCVSGAGPSANQPIRFLWSRWSGRRLRLCVNILIYTYLYTLLHIYIHIYIYIAMYILYLYMYTILIYVHCTYICIIYLYMNIYEYDTYIYIYILYIYIFMKSYHCVWVNCNDS